MNYSPKVVEAAKELRSRQEKRRSLKAWCEHVLSPQRPAFHHSVLISFLEKVARGEIEKLMIMMPPGSAKSRYTSVAFVSWFLAQPCRHEGVAVNSILACSYSKDLVVGFGRQCRNHVEQNEPTLGYCLASDSKAADEWEIVNSNNQRGRYFCAGCGSGIAGHRATLGLIDDPIGTEEEAMSKTEQDKLLAWYDNDFLPRLLPSAPQILICNRRGTEDLAGKLLAREGHQWTVLKFSLISREANDVLGRPPLELAVLDKVFDRNTNKDESSQLFEEKVRPSLLWPDWFDRSTVERAMKSPRTFAGLWQQEPTPEQGDFYQTNEIHGYRPEQLPPADEMRFYISTDYAVSKSQTADRVCLLPFALDGDSNIYILPDVYWIISPPMQTVKALFDLVRRRRPLTVYEEKGALQLALDPLINQTMRDESLFFVRESLSSSTDKRSRSTSIRGRMQQGKVFFPFFASWWTEARAEMLAFTGSGNDKHDDFCDALSKIGQALDGLVKGTTNTKETEEQKLAKAMQEVMPERITMGWVKRSHDRNERSQRTSCRITLDK